MTSPATAPSADELKRRILELVASYNELVSEPKPFRPGETMVQNSGKVVAGRERELMVEAALDGWLTTGRFNADFEAKLAKWIGVKHLITVNSGSSANLVAFSALTSPSLRERAIQPGDEVITVAAGFPTTVNPILQHGAVPVFVDVDIPTYNIDVSLIEAAITTKTRAIMIAHTLGNPFDVAAVKAICEAHGLWLVEDCCDALGTTYQGRKVGTFGDVATVSFYPAHHITMGEGGAVFTNTKAIRRAAESFRDWGRDCFCEPGRDNTCNKRFGWKLGELPQGYDHKYIYSHLGYNLKITDMQAACGVGQLERLDAFVATRRRNFTYLMGRLEGRSPHLVLPRATPGSDPSWFGFPITLTDDAPLSRRDLTMALDKARVGTRLLFGGNLTRQPYMSGRTYRVASSLERTDRIMRQTFWVGVHAGLDEPQLDWIADSILNALGAR